MYLTSPTAPWQNPRPTAENIEPTYTTREVAKLTGVTERMLQWWDECGVICPRKLEHQRLYTVADVSHIERTRDLRKAGIPLYDVHKYWKWDFKSAQKITVPTIIAGILVVPK